MRPLRNVFSRRIDLFHRGDLAVLFNELDDHVSELRYAELVTFVRNELLIRRADAHDVESAARPKHNLELGAGCGLVSSGDALSDRLDRKSVV